MKKFFLPLLTVVASARATYYNTHNDCPRWSVCSSWLHDYPLINDVNVLALPDDLADFDTLSSYSEYIDGNGACKFGVTSWDSKPARECPMHGCGATYHTCRCVSAEESNLAKQRKKNGLKIAGYVTLGVSFIFMLVCLYTLMDEYKEQGCAGLLHYSFFLVGFILVVCGFLAVHLDTFWAGCGDWQGSATPRYVYHTLYQTSNGNAATGEAVAVVDDTDTDITELCTQQKAIDCVSVCDVTSPPTSICGVSGACKTVFKLCQGQVAAGAVSLLNVTVVNATTYDSGYDKAAELKQGYIALGAMLGSCALFSIFAACNMSGGNPCGGGGQVEPSRSVVVAAVAVPAAPPAPANGVLALHQVRAMVQPFASGPLEAPPPYHPSMGVQYDGVKTSAL